MLHVKFGRIVFLVVAMASVGQFANTIFVPALSMIANSLHIRPEQAQYLMTAYLLPYGTTQLIYGPLSDIFGRRPMVMIGLCIFMIGSMISSSANQFHTLLVGCLIQGLGTGVAGVMARTVMRDCYSDHKLYKANSLISIALIVAPLLAPVLGGLLSIYFGWRSDFIFLLFFCTVVLALEYALFPETHLMRPKDKSINLRQIGNKYRQAFSQPVFIGFMACLALSFAGIAVFEASASALLTHTLHYSAKAVTFLFIIPIPGYMVGSYLAGYLNRFLSLRQLLRIALLVIFSGVVTLSLPAFAHVLNIYVIMIPITLYMFGTGLLFPTAMTGALNPLGTIAGTAGAILGAMQNITAAVMTAMYTLIPQTTQRPLALMLDICFILMFIAFIALLRQTEIEN